MTMTELIRSLIGAWGVSILILYFISLLVRGITLNSFGTAVFGGLLLGLVNAVIWKIVTFIKPLFWLTQFLTLGAFGILVNTLILWIVSFFVPGMKVKGFWPAVVGGILLGLANAFAKHYLF